MGLKHVESVDIKSSGTQMIVGQIEHLIIPDEAMDERGYIDLAAANTAGISGLNSYYGLEKLQDFPYARVTEVPKFNV